jgi:hypothetical protein
MIASFQSVMRVDGVVGAVEHFTCCRGALDLGLEHKAGQRKDRGVESFNTLYLYLKIAKAILGGSIRIVCPSVAIRHTPSGGYRKILQLQPFRFVMRFASTVTKCIRPEGRPSPGGDPPGDKGIFDLNGERI